MQTFAALFPFPPTSNEHQFYGLTSDFTRLIMKIKFVCDCLIYSHVNFHDNRTMRTVILFIKNCRWGGGGWEEKEPRSQRSFWMVGCRLLKLGRQNIHDIYNLTTYNTGSFAAQLIFSFWLFSSPLCIFIFEKRLNVVIMQSSQQLWTDLFFRLYSVASRL